MGMAAGHLGQWNATILAIFRSPVPATLQEKSFVVLSIFLIQMYGAHRIAQGSKLDLAVKTTPKTQNKQKTNKRQCTTIILATLVDLPSLMICAKIQPHGVLVFF